MTNGFRGLLVGGGEPIYVKLKEVEKLAVRHFKYSDVVSSMSSVLSMVAVELSGIV